LLLGRCPGVVALTPGRCEPPLARVEHEALTACCVARGRFGGSGGDTAPRAAPTAPVRNVLPEREPRSGDVPSRLPRIGELWPVVTVALAPPTCDPALPGRVRSEAVECDFRNRPSPWGHTNTPAEAPAGIDSVLALQPSEVPCGRGRGAEA